MNLSRYYLKRKLLTPFLIFCSLLVAENMQGQARYSYQGQVLNAQDSASVKLATCTFYSADSAIVFYSLTDNAGKFKADFSADARPAYLLLTSSGYSPGRIKISADTQNIGTVILKRSTIKLDSILVRSEIPPVIIIGDTIEYSAAAFRMLPNSLLKDLLKKFPGVRIDDNKNIWVNGKQVDRIRVDGRDFFGGNIELATENLPADIIAKVQFYDEGNGGLFSDLEAKNTILNIKLKKNVKKGWFGKVYGGASAKGEYETGGIFNLFRDTLQISLLGYSNNINKEGFGIGDIRSIGGFSRNMNAKVNYEGKLFSVNGISFGGTEDGIQRSDGAGFNLNHHPLRHVDINFNYIFSGTDNTSKSNTFTTQSIKNEDLISANTRNRRLKSYIHYFSGTARYKNKNTTIKLEGKVNLLKQKNQIQAGQKISLNDEQTNYSLYALDGTEHKTTSLLKLDIKHISSSKRSMVEFSSIFTGEPEHINGSFELDSTNNQGDKTDFRRRISNFGSTSSVIWRKRIAKKDALSIKATFEYRKEKIDFSNKTAASNGGDSLFNSLFLRKQYVTTISPSFSFNARSARISLGENSNFLALSHFGTHYFSKGYHSPAVNIALGNFSASYGERVKVPSPFYFVNYHDINTPFTNHVGNLSLIPSVQKFVSLNYQHFDFKKGSSIFSFIQAAHIDHAVIFTKTLNVQNGIMERRPVNSEYEENLGFSINYSNDLAYSKSQKRLSYSLNFNPYFGVGFVSFNDEASRYHTVNMTPSIRLSTDLTDAIELSTKFQFFYNNSKFENRYFTPVSFSYYGLSPEIVIRKKGFIVESSLEMYLYGKLYGTENSYLWNLAVSRLFLKSRRLQVKMSVFDLLNKNRGVIRTVSGNSFTSGENLRLGRYFMLSVIFNIRNLRVRKPGGHNSLLYY